MLSSCIAGNIINIIKFIYHFIVYFCNARKRMNAACIIHLSFNKTSRTGFN